MAREGIVVLVVVTCLVSAVAGTLQDGLPRPTNIADEPFKSHGPLPETKYPNGTVAKCKWYGFRNTMYTERIVTACVNELRTALADSSLELILEPFAYYYLAGDVGADPATDDRYCYEGCFDIDSGSYNSPAPSPGGNFLEGPSLAPSPGGKFIEGPSPATSPGGDFLRGPSLAPSTRNNLLRGPSLAPSFSPCHSRAPVPSPAYAPSLESPTPSPESGA